MAARGKNRMHYLLLFCVVTIYMVKKTTRHGKELVSEALHYCRLGENASSPKILTKAFGTSVIHSYNLNTFGFFLQKNWLCTIKKGTSEIAMQE